MGRIVVEMGITFYESGSLHNYFNQGAEMSVTMSGELHVILGGHPSMTAKEALAIFRKRNPKFKVNENSFNVAFSNARKKLGYRKNRKESAKPKTVTKVTNNLHAAAAFVKQVGGIQEAEEAIQQLQQLQLS